MKKILSLFITAILIMVYIIPAKAIESDEKQIFNINEKLEEINTLHNTNFHVYSENEYYDNKLNDYFLMDYTEYIKYILSYNIDELLNECLSVATTDQYVTANISSIYTRSTSSSKTVSFNQGRNKMTLKYKYKTVNSTKYFDTSFKPTATVSKVSNTNYFQMSSYTGKFSNSNKTYTVTAKGNIITNVGIVNKTFTVNFNLN